MSTENQPNQLSTTVPNEDEEDTSLFLKLQLDCESNDSISNEEYGIIRDSGLSESGVLDNCATTELYSVRNNCVENSYIPAVSPKTMDKIKDVDVKGNVSGSESNVIPLTKPFVDTVAQSKDNIVRETSSNCDQSTTDMLMTSVVNNAVGNHTDVKVASIATKSPPSKGDVSDTDTLKLNDTNKENASRLLDFVNTGNAVAVQKPKKQKARKSFASDVKRDRRPSSPITVAALAKRTIKVTELESKLGIKPGLISIDGSVTLEKLFIQKQQHQQSPPKLTPVKDITERPSDLTETPILTPMRIEFDSPSGEISSQSLTQPCNFSALIAGQNLLGKTKRKTKRFKGGTYSLPGKKSSSKPCSVGTSRRRRRRRQSMDASCDSSVDTGSVGETGSHCGEFTTPKLAPDEQLSATDTETTENSISKAAQDAILNKETHSEEKKSKIKNNRIKPTQRKIDSMFKKAALPINQKHNSSDSLDYMNNLSDGVQEECGDDTIEYGNIPTMEYETFLKDYRTPLKDTEFVLEKCDNPVENNASIDSENCMTSDASPAKKGGTILQKNTSPLTTNTSLLKQCRPSARKSGGGRLRISNNFIKKCDVLKRNTSPTNSGPTEGNKKIKRRRKRKQPVEEDGLSTSSTVTGSSADESTTSPSTQTIQNDLAPLKTAPKRRKMDKPGSELTIPKTVQVTTFGAIATTETENGPPVVDHVTDIIDQVSSGSIKPKLEQIMPVEKPKTTQITRLPAGKIIGQCIPVLPLKAKLKIEPAESDSSESAPWQTSTPVKVHQFHMPQAVKFNTPNGLTYPVTPPQTPESSHSSQNSAEDRTAALGERSKDSVGLPLCCCTMSGTIFAKVDHLYCHALDSVDGKTMACFNKVTNSPMVRSSARVPFMALCEVHRHRFRHHQCCPGCGQFCTQGVFIECNMVIQSLVKHYSHKNCQVTKDDKCYCPHCGEQSLQIETRLEATDSLNLEFIKSEKPPASNARMGVGSGQKTEDVNEDTDAEAVSLTTPDSKCQLSTKGMPAGPSKEDLQSLMEVFHKTDDVSERPGKVRKGNRNLYHASKSGDTERVLVLLLDGTDSNTKFEEHSRCTALHIAATRGHLAVVHLLLQAGSSPHAIDAELKTPLMCAVCNCHSDVALILVQSGALVDVKAYDGMTPLHLAAKAGDLKSTKMIITTAKIDVNITDDGGWTPLIWAAEFKHLDVIKYLMVAGSDPNVRDNEGNTGLHWACFSGSTEIAVVFLSAGCDIEASNEHGDRPLHIAARQDHIEVVSMLLARCADSLARNNTNDTPADCVLDTSSQLHMALQVNKQLKTVAAKVSRPEKLLHRDVSRGKEQYPIPIVNAFDDENYPTDYQYVSDYIESQPMNINRVVTSLQACDCKDNCSTLYCNCGRNSVRCWYTEEGRLIDSFNYSEPPFVFECNRQCRCWTTCQNRVIQLGITVRLQVFRCPGKGWGVRPLLDIPKGTYVCEYIGELLSDAEADKREDDSYLFDLDNRDSDSFCIDACRYGNVSRFINHSCDPNLIPVKVFVDHQDLRFPRICFFARRHIKAYEELGFDYCEKFWIIKYTQFTCECGAAKCNYSTNTIQKTVEAYHKRQGDTDSC